MELKKPNSKALIVVSVLLAISIVVNIWFFAQISKLKEEIEMKNLLDSLDFIQANKVSATVLSALELKGIKRVWESDSIEGSVYNGSNETVSFIKVKVTFTDEDGKVVHVDSTYAGSGEYLAPEESIRFALYFDSDLEFCFYDVEIVEYSPI